MSIRIRVESNQGMCISEVEAQFAKFASEDKVLGNYKIQVCSWSDAEKMFPMHPEFHSGIRDCFTKEELDKPTGCRVIFYATPGFDTVEW